MAVVGPAVAQAPEGGGRRQRKRLVVTIDGKDYEVRTEAQAAALLKRVRTELKREGRARLQAIRQEPRKLFDLPEPPRIQLSGESPLLGAVRRRIQQFQQEMEQLLAQANARAEVIMAEQDDEDILLLL